jgi:hypothetical protein
MGSQDLAVNLVPARSSMGDMTVTGRVRIVGQVWEVVVVLSRPAGTQPIAAAEVQVQLIAANGELMELLDGPRGPLPEFGGGLGTSVNARYRFGSRMSLPERLIIRHQTKEIAFRLVPCER